MSNINTVTWFTVDNLRGDSWSEFADDFVDAEFGFDKFDTDEEAIVIAEALKLRGERKHSVTKHWVHRDGNEHTQIIWS